MKPILLKDLMEHLNLKVDEHFYEQYEELVDHVETSIDDNNVVTLKVFVLQKSGKIVYLLIQGQ